MFEGLTWSEVMTVLPFLLIGVVILVVLQRQPKPASDGTPPNGRLWITGRSASEILAGIILILVITWMFGWWSPAIVITTAAR